MAGVLHLLTHQLGNSVRSPMMAALCKPAHQVWYTFCERAICVLDKLSLLRAAQGTWCAESLGAVQKVTVASSHKPVAPKDEKDLPHVIVACLGAGRVYTLTTTPWREPQGCTFCIYGSCWHPWLW